MTFGRNVPFLLHQLSLESVKKMRIDSFPRGDNMAHMLGVCGYEFIHRLGLDKS